MKRSSSISRLPLPKVSISNSTPNTNTSKLQRSLSSSFIGRRSSIQSAIRPSSVQRSRNRSKSPYKNNKNWLSDQHARICGYLLTSNPILFADGVNIQPPTIATFVEVMNLLFQKLDSRISITVENYKTAVPDNLKIIQYPHSVAPSLLKTVNTMHAWPQVISIFSWLIDFITFLKTPTEDELCSIILNYFASRFLVFCKDSTNTDNAAVDEAHKLKIEQYFKIDNEALAAAEAELNVKEQLCNQKKIEFNEMMERKKNLTTEIEKIQAELDEFYNSDGEADTELLNSIEDLKNQVETKDNACKSASVERMRLEEIVNTQKYSVKDKQVLEMEIDGLKKDNELKKEYFAEKRALSDVLDFDFVKAKNELDQEICRINKELLPLCLFDKKLSKFELTTTNFVATNCDEKIQEYLTEKETVEKQYISYLEKLKKSASQLNVNEQDLQEKTKEISECLANLKEKLKFLNTSMKSVTENIEQIILEANNKIRGSFNDMQIKNSQTLKNALTELDKLYYMRSVAYKEMKKRAVKMAVALHNLQVEKLKFIHEGQTFVVNTIQNNLQQIYEEQSKFLKQFEQLEKDNSENAPALS